MASGSTPKVRPQPGGDGGVAAGWVTSYIAAAVKAKVSLEEAHKRDGVDGRTSHKALRCNTPLHARSNMAAVTILWLV